MSQAVATFGQGAAAYADSRPGYPSELFSWLASQCARRETVWDCATGNGQAAVGLAHWFARVHATDGSAEQIAHAMPAARVTYAVATAERCGLPDNSVDLVTVAQALHWFDHAAFWPEVVRVAAPGAVFAAWGYIWPETAPEIDAVLIAPVREVLAPHWAANNRLLWNGYLDAEIRFPFARLTPPRFSTIVRWSREQIIAYLQTWSAWRLARGDRAAAEALDRIIASARSRIAAEPLHSVHMPLTMAVGAIG